MRRRDALKAMAVATVAMSVANAYDETLIVNTADISVEDPANLSDFEKKHLPQIEVKDTDEKGYSLVEVNIGQSDIIHPSDADHWIYAIELFADDKLIGKVSLEPVISRGFLSVRTNLKDVKTLKAISRCNLHGNFTFSVNL